MPKYYIETQGLSEMVRDMHNASQPMKADSLLAFEATWKAMTAAVQARVHVDTGYLKASGRSDTHYDGDTWTAEMQYARRPGIYELARGDKPTYSHPEGGHFFFEPVENFYPSITEDIDIAIKRSLGEL